MKTATPTLHQPATYAIKVPGQLHEAWTEWVEGMTLTVESAGDGPPITTLIVTVDQAALQGLLRWLYSLGLPLISANWIAPDSQTIGNKKGETS